MKLTPLYSKSHDHPDTELSLQARYHVIGLFMIRNSPCMKIGDVLRQLFPRNWSQRTCGSRIFQELLGIASRMSHELLDIVGPYLGRVLKCIVSYRSTDLLVRT